MKRTVDNKRIAIEVTLHEAGERRGSLVWVNDGNRLQIEPIAGPLHQAIQSLVRDVQKSTGLRKRRLVRAVAQAWHGPNRSAVVEYDAHRPRLRALNVADLPFELLTHLYWRPQALGLKRENVDSKALDKRSSRLPELRESVWPKEETWVNKVLDTVLASAPPRAIAESLAGLVPQLEARELALHQQEASAISDHVGDPDFALWDETSRTLVLGESKIGAKKTNGRYSFDQFSKYMLYGALMEIAGHATRVLHVVLAPSLDPHDVCNDAKQWDPAIDPDSGTLSVDPARIRLSGKLYQRKDRYHDLPSWQRYAREHLLDPEWREANGDYLDTAVDERLTAASAPVLVPTYVMTWDRWSSELVRACRKHGAGHLAPAIERLRELGNGDTD